MERWKHLLEENKTENSSGFEEGGLSCFKTETSKPKNKI
jgi:hypothetical protein